MFSFLLYMHKLDLKIESVASVIVTGRIAGDSALSIGTNAL